MNIDLLPFTAFTLQSCAGAPRRPGEAQTLTLQPAFAPNHFSHACMSGRASIDDPVPGGRLVLRACVVPAAQAALTITFR
ncbi:MAG: hypothetical protein H0X13_13805 [Ramlibacter sp.]|nr:hypothetical protein [Ramlibacter sp.]